MADNPYKPPAAGADTAAEEGMFTFSDYDLETVSKMTTWMRLVSSLQFVIGLLVLALLGWIAIATRGALFLFTPGIIVVVVLVAYVVLFMLGAQWLRKSCIAFYEGVEESSETGLAAGFRKLRLYLVLYGVFTVLGLVGSVLKLLAAGGAR